MAYTTIVSGTNITSSWANANVRDQVVSPFGSTLDRTAAITGPIAGMVSTLTTNTATEGVEVYNSAGQWRLPWNMPWGFVQYTQTTTPVTSGNNATILTGNTLSVVNRRRYRITGFVPFYSSTAALNTAEVQLVVGGTVVSGQRVFTSQVTSGENGATVVAYYTATATNASLACNLYSAAVVGTDHRYGASATTPIFIGVEDIGPSGAPA
jgi:type IV secretory pathway protease TraF